MSITSKRRRGGVPGFRHKTYIPKVRVNSFIKLFESIKGFTGTNKKAEKLCGLAHATIFKMKSELYLTTDSATKILSAYNKIKLERVDS